MKHLIHFLAALLAASSLHAQAPFQIGLESAPGIMRFGSGDLTGAALRSELIVPLSRHLRLLPGLSLAEGGRTGPDLWEFRHVSAATADAHLQWLPFSFSPRHELSLLGGGSLRAHRYEYATGYSTFIDQNGQLLRVYDLPAMEREVSAGWSAGLQYQYVAGRFHIGPRALLQSYLNGDLNVSLWMTAGIRLY
ncbi:MAG: hypothetical protein NW241_06655 [Bacteroidia bacterium]|nr:hypothetical protein [Bacteroidia bacterium]